MLGYFLCLGLGFILVEIGFMQTFVLFLGHPIYALAVVLASLLAASGHRQRAVGPRDRALRPRGLRPPGGRWLLAGVLLVYAFALTPAVPRAAGAAAASRASPSSVVLVFVPGLLMGTLLPSGVRVAQRAGAGDGLLGLGPQRRRQRGRLDPGHGPVDERRLHPGPARRHRRLPGGDGAAGRDSPPPGGLTALESPAVSPMFRGASLLLAVVGCGGSSASPPGDAAVPDAAVDSAVAPDAAHLGGDAGAPTACGVPAAGSAWAVWRLTEPAARQLDTSVAEVVSEPATGLMWQRKAASEQLGWNDAVSYCSRLQLAGFDDWRLPRRMELLTIVDYRRQEPSIDPAFFPDTPNTWFWTSSLVAGEPHVAWYLAFMDGNTHEGELDRTYGVRCVRGQPPARTPYQVSAGTVLDRDTNLTWQQAPDGTERTWEEARAHCASLPLAGGGWRLPTMAELQSLIRREREGASHRPHHLPRHPQRGLLGRHPPGRHAALLLVRQLRPRHRLQRHARAPLPRPLRALTAGERGLRRIDWPPPDPLPARTQEGANNFRWAAPRKLFALS